MSREDILRRVAEVFGDIFPGESIPVRDELSAKDVKSWDSLRHISFILAIQSEFGLRFEAKNIAKLSNIGQLVSEIERVTKS